MTMATILLLVFLVILAAWFLRTRILRLPGRLRRWGEAERILREDALKHLYSCEIDNEPPSIRSLAGQLNLTVDGAAKLLSKLQEKGLVKITDGSFRLTARGNEYALHVVRAHRLWERYLADKTGVSEVEWHGRAEKLEHEISREQADLLWAQLGHPTHDPHGDPLPTATGPVASWEGTPLLNAKPGQKGRVVHVEDEPESVYAKLVELRIFPGMELRVLAAESGRVRVLLEGAEKELGALEAANVTLGPLSYEETDFVSTRRLSDLEPGERGRVVLISRALRDIERRRLMDLGILPGTVISTEFRSLGGDPMAYRVRGALLALRQEQAEQVLISDVRNGDS